MTKIILIVIICVLLLALMLGSNYLMTRWLESPPKDSKNDKDDTQK